MPVTKVGSKWVGGELVFFDKATGNQVGFVGVGGFGSSKIVNLAAPTQTLTAAQSGQCFVGAVDAVFTLPASSAATKGVVYEFETGALSSGTGLSISPDAADAIAGNGLTATLDKDLINTGATDRLGDSVRIYCTGVAGATAWWIESIIGTWAKQA